SRPSQAYGMSRLIALTVAVAAGAMGAIRPASLNRDAVDFLETSHPVLDLFQGGTPEVPDAFFRRLGTNLDRAAAAGDDAGDCFGDRQHLVDAHAPLVAVGAVPASLGAKNLQPAADVVLSKAFLE